MVKNAITLLVLLAALYLGAGGLSILQNQQSYERASMLERNEVWFKGISFQNKEIMETAIQQELILRVFPYASKIPSIISFIITAISFGSIGAIGRVINDSIVKQTRLWDNKNLLLIPIQGALIGLIILGISFTIPVVLTANETTLNPVTIVFLSLFGGIFYLNFYKWFLDVLDKYISK